MDSCRSARRWAALSRRVRSRERGTAPDAQTFSRRRDARCHGGGRTISGIISGLAGAGGAASNTGSYYTNAANQIANEYQSPAANKFSQEYIASLQPGFKAQDQGLTAREAALGITNSGAAKADFSNLAGAQSSAEASGVAPLYSQGLSEYSGIISQEPSAQNQSYQQAIQNFYQALQEGASVAGDAMGVPSAGPGAQAPVGGTNPYDAGGVGHGGGT